MGLLDLFAVASIPVLKVLIMTSVGSLLATDHVNILGEDARKNLNNVSYFVIYELLHVTMILTSLLPLLLFILSVPFQLIITYTLQTITNNLLYFLFLKLPEAFYHLLILYSIFSGNYSNPPLPLSVFLVPSKFCWTIWVSYFSISLLPCILLNLGPKTVLYYQRIYNFVLDILLIIHRFWFRSDSWFCFLYTLCIYQVCKTHFFYLSFISHAFIKTLLSYFAYILCVNICFNSTEFWSFIHFQVKFDQQFEHGDLDLLSWNL